jgi:hypothetical protein
MKKNFIKMLLLLLLVNIISAWTIQGRWSDGGSWVTIATLQTNGNKRSAYFKATGTYLEFKFNDGGSGWYGDDGVTSSTNNGISYWYGNVGSSEGNATISSGITSGDYYLIAFNGDNSDFWTLEHIKDFECRVKHDVDGSPGTTDYTLTQSGANWLLNSAFTVSTSSQKWQFRFLPNGYVASNFDQSGGFKVAIVDTWVHDGTGYIANDQDHWIEWDSIPTGTYNVAVQLTGTSNLYEIQTTDLSLPVELTSFTAIPLKGATQLSWVTESEIDNLGFLLDRSLSPNSGFETIADYRFVPELQGQGSVTYRTDYSYTDKEVIPGTKYFYILSDVTGNPEHGEPVTRHTDKMVNATPLWADPETGILRDFRLLKVYPNPFNPVASISYASDVDGIVQVDIVDMNGNVVRSLINDYHSAGSYELDWAPHELSAGVYFCRMISAEYQVTRKIIYLK